MSDEEIASDLPAADYKILWAKSEPKHPLWKHLLDAAAVSLALPNPLSVFGWEDIQVTLIVGLHDIGKASPNFQAKSNEAKQMLA